MIMLDWETLNQAHTNISKRIQSSWIILLIRTTTPFLLLSFIVSTMSHLSHQVSDLHVILWNISDELQHVEGVKGK